MEFPLAWFAARGQRDGYGLQDCGGGHGHGHRDMHGTIRRGTSPSDRAVVAHTHLMGGKEGGLEVVVLKSVWQVVVGPFMYRCDCYGGLRGLLLPREKFCWYRQQVCPAECILWRL